MLTVWSGWWWLRKTWVTASGATPSAASGSRMQRRARATMPGSATISASPSRTRTMLLPTRSCGVAGVEQVDGRHRAAMLRRRDGRADARCIGASGSGMRDSATPTPAATEAPMTARSPRRPRPDRRPDRHDGRRPPMGQRARGPRRPDRRGRAGRGGPAGDRAADPRHRAARPDRHAGLPGRPRPPGRRRPRRCSAATCTTRCGRGDVPRRSSRRTPRPIPTRPWIRGGGWSMAAFPGGDAATRATSTGSSPTARSS